MEFKEYMIQRKKTAKESLIVVFAYLLATVVNRTAPFALQIGHLPHAALRAT